MIQHMYIWRAIYVISLYPGRCLISFVYKHLCNTYVCLSLAHMFIYVSIWVSLNPINHLVFKRNKSTYIIILWYGNIGRSASQRWIGAESITSWDKSPRSLTFLLSSLTLFACKRRLIPYQIMDRALSDYLLRCETLNYSCPSFPPSRERVRYQIWRMRQSAVSLFCSAPATLQMTPSGRVYPRVPQSIWSPSVVVWDWFRTDTLWLCSPQQTHWERASKV